MWLRMKSRENISGKVNACVYIDRGTLRKARELGLNVSRVCGNALSEAVGRLGGPEQAMGFKEGARVEGGIATFTQ